MAAKLGTKTERITGIPIDQLEKIIESYKAEGAISVSQYQETDGTWTVEVQFPED